MCFDFLLCGKGKPNYHMNHKKKRFTIFHSTKKKFKYEYSKKSDQKIPRRENMSTKMFPFMFIFS